MANDLINKHSPNSCQISFSGAKYRDAVDSLYDDATIYMKRKRDKWVEYVRYLNNKDNIREEKLSRKVVTLDKYGNYIGTYTFKDLKEEFNLSSIIKCCEDEKINSYKNFIWIYLDEHNKILNNEIDLKTRLRCKEKNVAKKSKVIKNIEQYDLKGNFINTWDTVKLAAEYYNTTSRAIRKVCTGERKTCCNYIWRYVEVADNKKNKVIRQYDINRKLIREWNNLREAAVFYDVTFQAIERKSY